jgi:hypothetical protein
MLYFNEQKLEHDKENHRNCVINSAGYWPRNKQVRTTCFRQVRGYWNIIAFENKVLMPIIWT